MFNLYGCIFYCVVGLLLTGCDHSNGKTEQAVIIPPVAEPEFIQTYPEFVRRDDYYGILEDLNLNSWDMKGHTIDYPECERSNQHFCKKIGIHYFYDGAHTPGREFKYTFDFTVEKWNFDDPAYHIIVWQDWFRHDANDPGGAHPFTTLKLKPWRGVSLAAYNNRWQWDYDVTNPYDIEDPEDNLHRHPEDEWTGQKQLEIGKNYHVEIIVKDGKTLEAGEVIISVDGELLSHEYYQTKPVQPVTTTVNMFGMYWYRDYNPRVNGCVEITGLPEKVCKSNWVKFENYEVFERIN